MLVKDTLIWTLSYISYPVQAVPLSTRPPTPKFARGHLVHENMHRINDFLCLVMRWEWSISPISFKVILLALQQSYCCPNANESSMVNLGTQQLNLMELPQWQWNNHEEYEYTPLATHHPYTLDIITAHKNILMTTSGCGSSTLWSHWVQFEIAYISVIFTLTAKTCTYFDLC